MITGVTDDDEAELSQSTATPVVKYPKGPNRKQASQVVTHVCLQTDVPIKLCMGLDSALLYVSHITVR